MTLSNNTEKLMKEIANSFMEIAKKKNYRKISVSEIMSPLHVSRQSFYYYFEDVADLINWINVQSLEVPFQTFHETKDLSLAYEVALSMYIRDRDFFKNVISFVGEGPFELSMYDKFLEGMLDHIGSRRLNDDERFSADIYLKGIIPVIVNAIKINKEIDLHKLGEQLCKALPQNLVKYYDFSGFEVVPDKGSFWR